MVSGFQSAGPLEVCQRYAAGLITRADLVGQLVSWPYKKMPAPNEFGEYEESTEGTFQEVLVAGDLGLVDGSIYEEVFNRLTKRD